MVKIIYFDYCAIAILLIMLFSLFIRKSIYSSANRSFLVVVLTITYSTLYDICAVALDNHGFGSVFFKYFMHAGYLILRNFVPVVYVFYIITLTDTWHKINKKKWISFILYAPFSIIAILTSTSFITKTIFYIDKKGVYTRGPLFILLYVSAAFYMIYGFSYAVTYSRLLSSQKLIPLILIIPFQIISIVVQFINPNLLVEMIFSALSALFIMLTLQRPDSSNDQITGLLKTSVYTNDLKLAFLNNKPLKLILINVTNFSSISSYLNYEKTSIILRKFSDRLIDCLDELDLDSAQLYYLGNGSYSIIIEERSFHDVENLTKLLNTNLQNDFILDEINLSLSCALCIVDIPGDFTVYEEFLAFERDLHKIKNHNEIYYASDLLKKKDYSIIANMDSILNDAIKENLFEVYYQPIYSINENRFNSAEALVRLKTEKYGFIRPDLFIPIAEDNGLIDKIDEIVFEEVCKFIASDEFKTLNLDYIEVNLSVVQCMKEDLSSKIQNTMWKYGILPSQINLEITETAAEYSQSVINKNINELHAAGISFSLDDFGTGYSNMTRVASLPLHIVKLDRSFTFTDNHPGLLHILTNTVDMIKKMNLKMVVEGVETEEMLNLFKKLECDYIQGYYFSKPIPRNEFVEYISARQ